MKKNDLVQLKELDVRALQSKSKDLKKELGNLILDKNMNKLNDLKALSKKRRELSQVFTILSQKLMVEKLETKLAQKKGESK